MKNISVIYRKRFLKIRERNLIFSLFLVVFLNFYYGYSQGGISTQLPEIIPPSPTVASLMKFEEIPVSNYTGIPDISIPIYNMETISKDLSVNVSLNYHPADIQISSVASCTGVGWSLFAGGSISRTVRGLPDEYTSGGDGIYSSQNKYLDFFYDQSNNYSMPAPFTEEHQPFYWDTFEKGLYDTEYDLYQYNFLGYTGRFILRKNKLTDNLEVIFLEGDTNLQIEYEYNLQSYEGIRFIVYDALGYKYIFEEKEITSKFTTTTKLLRDRTPVLPTPLPDDTMNFISGFHLSKIYDNNNIEIVSFIYQNIEENVENRTQTFYYYENEQELLDFMLDYVNNPLDTSINLMNLTPYLVSSKINNNIITKKIQQIFITNKGKIEFEYENGRQDINLEAVRLKKITIKDILDNSIKKFSLNHSYKGEGNRLVLEEVEEISTNNLESISYNLFYNQIESLPDRNSKAKDSWEYYNNYSYLTRKGETDINYVTYGVLQKMSLPTGGCIIFNFESNTYTYQGEHELTKFDIPENRDLKTISNEYLGYSDENNTSHRWFYINTEQEVEFKIDILEFQNNLTHENPNIDKSGWYFEIIPIIIEDPGNDPVVSYISSYTIDNTRQTYILRLSLCNENLTINTCELKKILKSGGYVIRFKKDNFLAEHPVKYKFTTKYYNVGNTYQYVYGGGVRIANIAYFDKELTPQDYHERLKTTPWLLDVVPNKELKFSYNEFDNPYRSSGSLVSFKPLFWYDITKNEIKRVSSQMGHFYVDHDYNYTVHTDFNNLSPIRTKGSDIGYRNVEVTSLNRELSIIDNGTLTPEYNFTEYTNGKTRYIYTNAIDYPEISTAFHPTPTPPFVQTKNIDYKRGLLKEELVIDINNNLKTHKIYNYEFVAENEFVTGIKIHSNKGCGYSKLFNNFSHYKSYYTNPQCTNQQGVSSCFYNCGHFVTDYTEAHQVREAIGWARLKDKTTKNYFYNPIGTIEVTETFDYNTLNKKISRHTTSNSLGEVIVSDYSYDTNFANRNRIGVLKSITTRNGEFVDSGTTLDIKTIEYNNNWTNPNSGISSNIAYLPETISFAKGSNPLETRLHYLKYDEYSNPLEVKQENGISIVYLWGYNQAYPIAKIENATYDEVVAALGTNNISETNLSAINALRTNPAFANAMITTYTYKPLVGVTSITDPRGYTTTYHYDNFNRLEFVRDAAGNILERTQYHYQN